ncbi:MBL fold metallo-hydrolase [Ottowia sp.]|uniref:MBL fold metallo-hydrolase n=1 Tax=Ottowia sp. TaxID=1898956 RepID=UPI0025E5CCDA|nr:MBL fold metallo-hydrolase [Ottowia sp.]
MSTPSPPIPIGDDVLVFDRGWLSSTNVLCRGDEPAVVDTGYVKDAEQTVALVQQALGDQPLARIAHTHLHSDHCGGTAALQAAWPQARTWVPQVSLAVVQGWDESALSFGVTGQRCARFVAQHGLRPGDTVRLGRRDWQIHAAPGHDNQAVLLFEPAARILIAGDALWEHGVGVIFPEFDGDEGFEPFERTLQTVEALQPEWVVPGHGGPIARADGGIARALGQARTRVQQLRAHPAQHALHAAKVMVKYQLLDAEVMPRDAFLAWADAAPILHRLHRQHRPDLAWDDWLQHAVLAPLLARGALLQDATHLRNGTG